MKIIILLLALHAGFYFVDGRVFAQDCPISTSERSVIENAVNNFVLDALYTAGLSGIHPGGFPTKAHFAYSATLLGQIRFNGLRSDPGIRESASLTELCTQPRTFDRTCRSEAEPPQGKFWKEHDVCVQITCEAKGIYKAEVEWGSLPDFTQRRFEYTSTGNRKIVYNPAPQFVWRLIDHSARRLIVTGELLSVASVISGDGKKTPATYTGNITAVKTDEGLVSFVLQMTFPAIRSLTPARAELRLNRHQDDSAKGSISVGDVVIATLELLPNAPLQINWLGDCQ